MNILVTGATGKVGGRVARYLVERGHIVRTLVRHPEGAASFRGDGIAPLVGDLLRPETLVAATIGIEAVVHCAATFRGATPEEMRAANEIGTLELARAAGRAGVRRFVFTSTSLVYGSGLGRPAREEDDPSPRAPYPQSKLAGERVLNGVEGLDVRVLRLAFVYGDGDPHLQEWLPRLRTWPGNRCFQLVHHCDVARGIEALLTKPRPSHRIYNIADEDLMSARAVLEVLNDPSPTAPDDERTIYEGVMDTSRIRDDLGFRALYPSLRDSISKDTL